MTPQLLFYIIIGILVLDFVIQKIIGALNARHFDDPIPAEVKDVYDKEEYLKSQAYKKINYQFGVLTSTFSFAALLIFFFLEGFAFVDNIVREISDNPIVIALLFFGVIGIVADLLSTPFSYYDTFVIEEKFGFNKTTKKTFFLDKLKSWLLGGVLGGGILAVVIWFYDFAGDDFWWYAWILISIFSVFMNLFYAKLIVPIFNKQTPLEKGSLRDKIEIYAKKAGFKLENIFVIDGSKRSTKANAYFSGFGKEKRITLYDTLISDLEEDEIVAVLAHEVGHYKKNHILFTLIFSVLSMGITLWLLSLFVGSSLFSEALGVSQPGFHIGLVVFGILYTPISELTGLLMNFISRRFEYQADDFAKQTYEGGALISSLKKLSKNSLSNLTPHPSYVFMYYSHPTLVERIRNLQG